MCVYTLCDHSPRDVTIRKVINKRLGRKEGKQSNSYTLLYTCTNVYVKRLGFFFFIFYPLTVEILSPKKNKKKKKPIKKKNQRALRRTGTQEVHCTGCGVTLYTYIYLLCIHVSYIWSSWRRECTARRHTFFPCAREPRGAPSRPRRRNITAAADHAQRTGATSTQARYIILYDVLPIVDIYI